MWFILICSWVCSQLFSFFNLIFKGVTLIGPTNTNFFLEHRGHSLPNRSISLDPQWQNRNKCVPVCPTFSVYVQGSPTWGKPKWDRTEMLLGTCWGNNLRTWGTWWEHIESNSNKKNKKKISLMRKAGPLMCGCWAFSLAAWDFYSTTVCRHFWPGAQTVGHGIESRSKRWAHSILRDLF